MMKRLVFVGVFCAVLATLTACNDFNIPQAKSADNENTKPTAEITESVSEKQVQSQTEKQTEVPTTATVPPTQPPTEAPTVTLNTEDCVTSAIEKNYKYTDNVGNAYDVTMRIPKINSIGGVSFDDVNEQIVSDCKRYFDEADKEMADKVSMITMSMDYDAYIINGVISISISHVSSFGGMAKFYIYNVDTETGNLVSNAEFAERLGMSYDELKEKVKVSLENDYQKQYDKATYSHYEENLAKTLNDDNIAEAKIFVAENGQLSAVCTEYTEVGAERYTRVIVVE